MVNTIFYIADYPAIVIRSLAKPLALRDVEPYG
jgi:hypothetical protein